MNMQIKHYDIFISQNIIVLSRSEHKYVCLICINNSKNVKFT